MSILFFLDFIAVLTEKLHYKFMFMGELIYFTG